jgi:tetratricopeptide (TPR) repeat protein
VLKEIGKAELVIMPWKQPLPPKRSWCVFEYSVIIKENLNFVCRIAPQDREDFKSHIRKNKTSSAFYSDLFGGINVLDARAERKSDQEKILKILQQVGERQVNDAVMKGLKFWLEDVMGDSMKEIAGKGTEEEANVLCAQGFFANALGKFDLAQISFENSLAIHKKLASKGAGNINVTNSNIAALKSNLALVLGKKNNYVEAEPLLRQALEFLSSQEDLSSSPHTKSQVAAAYTNLANVLRKLDRLEEAENMYDSALEIYHDLAKGGGANTPTRSSISMGTNNNVQMAVCLNNLGRLHQKKHQHEKACKLFERAYEIDVIFYGEEHPEVATDLHNLARSLKELGKRDEAIEKGQKALEIFIRVFGPDHPVTMEVSRTWSNRVSSKLSKPLNLPHQNKHE